MTGSDSEYGRRIARFVEALPIPDAPPMPVAPLSGAGTARARSRRPVWAGAVAAVFVVLLVVAAGAIRTPLSPEPMPAAPGSSVMPGRQWPWVTDLSRRPIGPVLMVARLGSTVEDSPLPSQTVLRDTTGARVATTRSDEVVSVSPDGRHLAVGSSSAARITLIDTVGGAGQDVDVPSSAPQTRPIGWSRDGRHVFVAGTRPARDPGSGLEVGPVSAVEVGTPAVRRIPDLDGAPSVSPSPDDRELAVALGGELRIVDAETGVVKRRVAGADGVLFDRDAWSDDGRWIVGVDRERSHLVRFDARTGEKVRVTSAPGHVTGVTWAGGRYLALRTTRTGAGQTPAAVLVAVDVGDGSEAEVAHWKPGLARDLPMDVAIARDLAGHFAR